MDIKINTTELYKILDITPDDQNIMLMGRHGIGKSEILKSYFEDKGMKFVPVFCSQAADPGDIIGLPYRDGNKSDYALPWWFPTDDTPVVIFLDELNRARPEILQVVQDLTLNKRLVGHDLPKGSRIVSAINAGDEYQVTDLDPALVSRFNVYEFCPTVEEWLSWGAKNRLSQDVMDFIRMYPDCLDEKLPEDADPMMKCGDRRAWTRVSDIMLRNSVADAWFSKAICGIVGASSGVKFYDYINNRKKMNPMDVLMDFENNEARILSMSVSEFVTMNGCICALLDTIDASGKAAIKDNVVSNLLSYLKVMRQKGREGMAHLIGLYESGKYPNFNIIVDTHPDTLQQYIYDFISDKRNNI